MPTPIFARCGSPACAPVGRMDGRKACPIPKSATSPIWKRCTATGRALSNAGLISLGFAWRGMFRNSALPREVYRTEFDAARKSRHSDFHSRRQAAKIPAKVRSKRTPRRIFSARMSSSFMRCRRLQRRSKWSPKPDSPVSLSPGTELRIGYGFTKISEYLDAGVRVGVSVDTVALAGNANLFRILEADPKYRERQAPRRVQDDRPARPRTRHH